MTDLSQMLREASTHAPHAPDDLQAIIREGRRRVRTRRTRLVAGSALGTTAATVAALSWIHFSPPAPPTMSDVPLPPGRSVRLDEARQADPSADYRVVASSASTIGSQTLVRAYDGVTDDGLVLARDTKDAAYVDWFGDELSPVAVTRPYSLLDPATGEEDQLPGVDLSEQAPRALELSQQRLVLMTVDAPGVEVFDRATRQWSTTTWPGLPASEGKWQAEMGPDGRIYALVGAGQNDRYDLWSASPTDDTDVRDEEMQVGAIGFTDDSLVWTDRINGEVGQVHVRNLESGAERSFDPQQDHGCLAQELDVAGDHLALTQRCGTYALGERDDRVQVMTLDGERLVTLQGSGIESARLSGDGSVVTIDSYLPGSGGSYVYDTTDRRLLRLSDQRPLLTLGAGPTTDDSFIWSTSSSPRGLWDRDSQVEVQVGTLR